MGSRRVWRWALAIAAMGIGCDDFLDFDTLRCGNGVIEPAADEDCDGLPGGSPYRCGPPGTAAACRLICDADDGCPSGWRCGRAGVCTAAAGRFGQPVVTRLDGDSVAVGDLDGDGRPDVLTNQRESLGVGYGRGDGAFEVVDSVSVPRANIPPALGDADGDGRADVALLDGDGLMLYLGSESRTLDPLAAPETVGAYAEQVVAVRATAPFAHQDVLQVTTDDTGLRFAVRGKTLEAEDVGPLPVAMAPYVVRAGQLDGGQDSAEEILVGIGGGGAIVVLDLRCAAQSCTLAPRARLPLANGRVVGDTGAFAGDLNLDGWPDVVVQARRTDALQVAWGSAEGLAPFAPTPGLRVASRGDGPQPALSDVVQIAGDARPDLIVRGTILALRGPLDSPGFERLIVPRRPYTGASVADVDGDGLPDVYGLLDGSLEFVLTRDDGLFLEDSSGIAGLTAVRAGDLDGNRFTDLVVQRAGGELEAYFGTADGAFAGPSRLGRFDPAAAWTVALLGDGRHDDAAGDVVVHDEGRAYAFAGSPQRVLTAPIPHADRPQGVAIARFADGPGVFVLGRTGGDLARVDGLLSGFAADDPALAIQSLPTEGCAPDLRGAGSVIRAVDWPGEDGQQLLQYDGISQAARLADAIQWVEVTRDGVRCRMVATLSERGRPLTFDRVDLDDDGRDELVAVVEVAAGAGQQAQLFATWPIEEGATVAAEVWPSEARVEGGAFVELGDRRRLLVASGGRLLQVSRVDGMVRLNAIGDAPRAVIDALAEDIDGDGLDDLVFKTATSVLVMPQVSCGARDAWDGLCSRSEAW